MNAFVLNAFELASLSLLVCYLIVRIIKRINEIRTLPPGPYGLPLVGYLLSPKLDFFKQFNELAKVYGERFSIRILNHSYVVLNNPGDMIASMKNNTILDRPPEGIGMDLSFVRLPISFGGLSWQNFRQISSKMVRGMVSMKNETEEFLVEEVGHFSRALKDDKSANLVELIVKSSSNNIFFLYFGRRFEYTDSEKKNLNFLGIHAVNNIPCTFGVRKIPLLFDILSFLGIEPCKSSMQFIRLNLDFIRKEVKNHQNPDHVHNYDLLDIFLETAKDSKFATALSADSIREIFFELVTASSATTITFHWIILFLTKYPDYQTRIKADITDAVGSRQISHQDRSSVPLLQAFINETLRLRMFNPLPLPRYTSDDTMINDFFVPKNTRIIMNNRNLAFHPSLFQEPDKFYPERFLSKDGKLEVPKHFVPFATGKRDCLGKNFAQTILFAYTSRLIQDFRIEAECGSENVCSDPQSSINVMPKQMPAVKIEYIGDN